MSAKSDRIIRQLTQVIKKPDRPATQPYDTQATVLRIEDGIAYVHIPGGVPETPVKLTIAASVGDQVQVRVSGGKAFLVGNASAPPTDDKIARQALSLAQGTEQTVYNIRQAIDEGGIAGKDGISVVRVVIEHCLATARTIPSGGTFEDIQYTPWSEQIPAYESGKFYWTRTVVYFSDNTVEYGTHFFDIGNQASAEAGAAAQEAAEAAEEAERIAEAAETVAGTKKRVFNSTPTPPYDVNDMWFDGAHGKVYLCATAKAEGQSYSASDWTEYATDVSNYFWYDSSGAHVSDTPGSVSSGNSQTFASSGTVLRRNGKVISSWTGTASNSASINFYDCSSANARTGDLIAAYGRQGITQYINNIVAMALTASGLSFYTPDSNHYLEAVFGSTGVNLYALGVLAMQLTSGNMVFYDADGITELASFGRNVKIGRNIEGSAYVTITSDGFKIYYNDNGSLVEVATFGTSTGAIHTENLSVTDRESWTYTIQDAMQLVDDTPINIYYQASTAYRKLGSNFVVGTPKSYSMAFGDLNYDGDRTFTYTYSYATVVRPVWNFTHITFTAQDNPDGYLSIGSNDNKPRPAYCIASGTGLETPIENQLVIGQYNNAYSSIVGIPIPADYAFMIGNGVDEYTRSNALAVDWSGNVDIAGNYQKDGSAFITTESYDLGTISITAGTPGTTSTTITKTITKSGYTPIAVKIRYVSTSIIGFNAFFNSDSTALYVQVIRRQSGAASPGYHAYADVTYIKN